MNKLLQLKSGGCVIDISPMSEWDFAAVFRGREMLILENNKLDGEIRRGYNPSIEPLAVSRKTKTSGKKLAKQFKAKTVTTK